MKNFTIYLTAFLCTLASKVLAQETFEAKAKAIANNIELVTKQQKDSLKIEIETVNLDLEKGLITKEQADVQKNKLAESRALKIEKKVAFYQEELKNLVQEKVDGKIKDNEKSLSIVIKNNPIAKPEKRTTSQFVFAIGANNLITDGQVAHSDFKYLSSRFYEWGTTFNTRLIKENNLLHAKYGISVMYNDLKPTDNRLFVKNGAQTDLETATMKLKDSRFRNVFVTVPVHLEFDFTKPKEQNGKTIFRSHESVRFGIGGYAGFRVKSKQKLCYESNGNDISTKEKGDFNVNDFIYGISAYLGYSQTSLYIKYDLNPLFKDNPIKQNNISLGVRFDWN